MVRIDRASARPDRLKVSPTSDWAGAKPQPSPTPIRNRQTASCPTPPAKPVRTVIRLQNDRPMAMTLRRLQRSASQAIGTPNTA